MLPEVQETYNLMDTKSVDQLRELNLEALSRYEDHIKSLDYNNSPFFPKVGLRAMNYVCYPKKPFGKAVQMFLIAYGYQDHLPKQR